MHLIEDNSFLYQTEKKIEDKRLQMIFNATEDKENLRIIDLTETITSVPTSLSHLAKYT